MSIRQYLERYAEPEAKAASTDLRETFDRVVIIPCKDEPIRFLERLLSFLKTQTGCLAIVVVNQSEASVTEANQQLWQFAIKQGFQKHLLGLIKPVQTNSLLLVDRFTSPIPTKQGVGLARKIGADIALALFHNQQIQSPWLHCTDADVYLESDYFELPDPKPKTAARLYPFWHQTQAPTPAIRLYEMRQAYYVAGLAWAGSPYAYHTVGSTLVLHAEHYAMVRGFPKLAAGEDFHILNKLAKTGRIETLEQPVLTIEHRLSGRVPYGTGPMMRRLNEAPHLREEPMFESPAAFTALKQLLGSLALVWETKELLPITQDETLASALSAVKFEQGINHAFAQSKTAEQFFKQVHHHFDALATLRFLNEVDRNRIGKINLNQLIGTKTSWFALNDWDFIDTI